MFSVNIQCLFQEAQDHDPRQDHDPQQDPQQVAQDHDQDHDPQQVAQNQNQNGNLNLDLDVAEKGRNPEELLVLRQKNAAFLGVVLYHLVPVKVKKRKD